MGLRLMSRISVIKINEIRSSHFITSVGRSMKNARVALTHSHMSTEPSSPVSMSHDWYIGGVIILKRIFH